jgi:hypothetical protein
MESLEVPVIRPCWGVQNTVGAAVEPLFLRLHSKPPEVGKGADLEFYLGRKVNRWMFKLPGSRI